MSESRCNTFAETVVESHNAAVGKRQLQFAAALLSCNLAGNGAVYLVGEPVFACHGLKVQNVRKVFFNF